MMWNHLYYMNIPQYATDSAVELAAYHSSYNSNPGEALATDAVTGVATPMTLRCGAKAPLVPSGIKCRREEEKRRGREAALECLKRAMTASSRQE
ncbi:hypothetical protein OIU77_026383 [Salix suchowensis]|uniref:Uncharacterized protein n=1 Tax=Salix suchowensis TaxID=1278906 RepID=A0ABQ9BP75_9ROSI|nr:hypothetical protein OIU77_026383 [Salix suchowensis]